MDKNEPTAGRDPRIPDPDNHDQQHADPISPIPTTDDQPIQSEETGAQTIEGGAPTSQVDLLVQIAEEGCELFHDPADTPYARLDGGIAFPVERSEFVRWLQSEFRRRTKRAANPTSLKTAINELAATARFEGPQRPVHLRVAEIDGGLALHLGGNDATSVVVGATGWDVGLAPVDFEKKRHSQGFGPPRRGGSLTPLGDLLNHGGETNLKMIEGWLLMGLKPAGPKPILIVQGPPGSAKSTMTEALKFLIDPAIPLLRTLPNSERNLAVAAANQLVLAFDNLSYINEDMSNALCRLSTGAGFGARALYTNDEEVVFEHVRPIILNGLDALATRQDLLSRSIVLRLPEIEDHIDEAVFWSRFRDARPGILGALMDTASEALRNLDKVTLKNKPRMADFVTWVTAAEPALGWEPGSFLRAFEENNSEALKTSLEGSLLAEKILESLDAGVELEGTPTDVLTLLGYRVSPEQARSKAWPRNAQLMGRQLTLLSQALRQFGVVVGEGHVGRGREKRRWLSITKVEDVEEGRKETGS